MKNIGIATLYFYNNFGSVLQAYAMKNVLESMGEIKAHILPYKPKVADVRYFKDKDLNEKYQKKVKKFDDFREKYLGVGPDIITDRMQLSRDYDGYITGSDIVWGKEFSNLDPVYFLDFPKNDAIKASYAASMILNEDGKSENDLIYEKYIKTFDYVAVRENKTAGFIQRYTDKKVHTVIDPTLLLKKEDYEKIEDTGCGRRDGKPYILSYFLTHDPAVVDYTNIIAKKLGLKVVHYFADYPDRVFMEDSEDFAFAGPLEFLGLVKNAECIFTNSFHGTCFSLIYRKPFYTYTAKRSLLSRVRDLADRLEISDRCFTDFKDIDRVTMDMDYGPIDSKLDRLREDSMSYLHQIVEGLYV